MPLLLNQRKALIFRITHIANMPWILRNGQDYEQFSDRHYATEQAVAQQSGNGVWVMGCDSP